MITNAKFIWQMDYMELVEWLCNIGGCMKNNTSDPPCSDKTRCHACWTSWLDKEVDKEKELKKALKEINFKVNMMPSYDDLNSTTLHTLEEIKSMAKSALKRFEKGNEG